MEYPKHKCFISFKMEDEMYKKQVIEKLDKENFIDKSLKEPIDSDDEDYVMRKIRKDYLSDSTVTIFLIGTNSAENSNDDQTYIKRELQGSLYNGEGNTRSGILGVVLPTMYAKIFGQTSVLPCAKCGQYHQLLFLNDDTVIREFSRNYFVANANKVCDAWQEDEQYCVLTSWDEFMRKMDFYIDKAYNKRSDSIADKVVVYPK